MHLRLTLVTDQVLDLAIDGATGARWRNLLAELGSSGLVDADHEPGWYIGATALAGEDPLGVDPLVDGAVISAQPVPDQRDRDGTSALLQLYVTSGPDAGQIFDLSVGEHRVGRAPPADLCVRDRNLSRTHLTVHVSATGVSVRDVSTTNGSWLGDGRLGVGPERWEIGERLRIGSTVLELTTHGSPSAAIESDDQGQLLVNRRPRRFTAPHPVELHLPAAPTPADRARLPLLTMVVPLFLAVPMAWLQRSPAYLLFGLMSPAMMLGNVVSERRDGRRDGRRSERDVAMARYCS